jgi:hypothetical protein
VLVIVSLVVLTDADERMGRGTKPTPAVPVAVNASEANARDGEKGLELRLYSGGRERETDGERVAREI